MSKIWKAKADAIANPEDHKRKKSVEKAHATMYGEQITIPDTIECNGGTLHFVERDHPASKYEGTVDGAYVVLFFWAISDTEGEDLDIFIGNSESELDDEGYIDPWTGTEGRFKYSELADYVNEGIRTCRERGYIYKSKSTKKSKNVKKYDEWTVSNLFDELEDAVYDWDEGWIDNVMDANYSQAHGNVKDACKYLEDMYDECRVPRIATLCERIFTILGHSEYCASTKKSKQNHSKSMCKAIAKRYRGDESDPDWDSDLGRWKLGGDTHVKVYQMSGDDINNLPEDDPKVRYFMRKYFGYDGVKDSLDLSYYDQIWEGDLNVHGNLDDIYGMLQDYRPIETSQAIYSLSVGDLIEMNGRLYMVDRYGFKEVTDLKRSAKKSYTPNYQDFRSMVKSIKTTGNHNNVFKE